MAISASVVSPLSTLAELRTAAIAPRPKLLLRAGGLTYNNRADADGFVQDVYLIFVRKPPAPRSDSALLHWLRTCLLHRRSTILLAHRRDRVAIVSLDALEGWVGG